MIMNIKLHTKLCILLLFPVIAVAQEPDLYFRGLSKMELENYPEAITYFSEAISEGTIKSEIYLNRARCFYESGEFNSAINDLLVAEKLKKYSGSYELARIYALTGKKDSAIFYLERHLSSSYKLPASSIKLDTAFTSLEDSRLWKDLWSKEWYNDFELLHAEIKYLIKSKQYIDALDLIDQNLTEYAHRPQIYAARGEIFIALENYHSAVTAYSHAIELTKTHTEYYIQRGTAYSKLGKYDSALDDMKRAINLEPENFSLYIELSRLYDQLKTYDKSLKEIYFYLELFPEDDHAIYQCGQIYYDQGSYLKALEWFNKCLKINKSEAEYFAARGNTYLQTKTYKYAIRDYGMSLDLDPDNPEVYLNKGLARLSLDDKKGACSDWQKAVRYGSAEARELLNIHCQNLR
jgi:tetratricopeptide (TPR) repeat protein